jgi:hypothetical protein
MASDALQCLRKVQLTRSLIVGQLQKPNVGELLSGLYVRVLLELEGGGEEYKIARVTGVERGADYSGFTYDSMVSTDKYLVLELSPPAKSDNHYQLNSVSNKEFQTVEYQAWQRDVAAGRIPRPTDADFASLSEKMRRLSATGPPPPSTNQVSLVGSVVALTRQPSGTINPTVINNNATFRVPNGAQLIPCIPPGSGPTPPTSGVEENDSDDSDYDQTEEDIVRMVEEEKRDKHFVVANDLGGQTTQQLRLLEKDILEYLDRVRENLDTHTTKCIACMVHEPAIIIMPCKHKVLCRGCCTKVLICPMCRVKIREVFEPVEM